MTMSSPTPEKIFARSSCRLSISGFRWTKKSWTTLPEQYRYCTMHHYCKLPIWQPISQLLFAEKGLTVYNSVDDIQDNSNLRRGYPTAHRIYGSPQTINSANYVYFLALQQLSNSKNWPQAAMIFNEELLNLHRGQGMDLFWRDTFTVPTEADYLKMISNKTGGLFRLALRLMQAESSQEINLLPLIETLGLIFQIRDDYENLCSDEVNTYSKRSMSR